MSDGADALRIDTLLSPTALAEALRDDVRIGLRSAPKELPPKWFYDDVGSALFDDITRLDEYYPTRRETEILEREAAAIATAADATALVELGSGTSTKTRLLLDAMHTRGALEWFLPFDVNEAFLRDAAETLQLRYRGLRVHGLVGDFERHLGAIPRHGRRMVAFLGSTIGNLDPAQRKDFLASLVGGLVPGDTLLLGADLVKDPRRLVAAYDDARGITAAFNRNVLTVVNRSLDADFDVSAFAHEAHWNADDERIEMWLRAERPMTVVIEALGLSVTFAEGEAMRTEISCKFRRSGVEDELRTAGLEPIGWWTDAAGEFGLSLSIVR